VVAASIAAVPKLSTAAVADAQANVPVKEVVLYSSGVGYFEHFGSVNGNADTVLRFKTEQINDILKSLVLEDMDGGKVAAVTYPSQGPVARTLKSFQIDLTANPALADLLNQLRGAQVSVAQAAGLPSVDGTVMGVEKQQRASGDAGHTQLVDVWVVNLVNDSGIQPVELSKVSGVKIVDPELRKELAAALGALSQARDKDKKPVEIHFGGKGDRRVRIGYVVETPVWKTSYRLILPSKTDDAKKGSIQGWAIVENQTDSDWKDVQLSLVSGRPISFIEDLYQPLYVPRPVVQPQIFASLRPQTYGAGLEEKLVDRLELRQEAEAAAAPKVPQQQLQQMARQSGGAGFGGGGGFGGGRAFNAQASDASIDRSKSIDPTASIASIASAAKVGELFQYTVGSVSIARQQSAMLPIVTDPVQVEKLSIYNQSVMANNPLLGARLKNTTGKFLMQGPITVLAEGSYAGDASIEDLPPTQQRLISYGVDQEVTVRTDNNTQNNTLLTGKIVKGVLELTYKQQMSVDYIAEDKSENPKSLLIESPRHGGWDLIEPKTAIETTDSLYRFEGKLEPHKASKLTVREQHIDAHEIALLPLDLDSVVVYVKEGLIPKNVRDALAKAAQLKAALLETQRQIQERMQRINEIGQEQTRIRANMGAVNSASAYSKRLLQELDDQETQIQDTRKQAVDLQKQQNQRQKELEDFLSNLNVG
jgi:hypothetical protein